MPEGTRFSLAQKSARSRKTKMFVGSFVFISGLPPLINLMGNPRVATLHGFEVAGLVAAGMCLGFGLALLLGPHIFPHD